MERAMMASLDWKKVNEEWEAAQERWGAVRRWMAAETAARVAGTLGPDEGYPLERYMPLPRKRAPRPKCRPMSIPWDELDGEEWVVLLSLHPARAEFCDWTRLNGENWVDLLVSRPEFAKTCAWEKLDGKGWRRLLVMRPEFAGHCRWEKLGKEDWEALLAARPELAGRRRGAAPEQFDGGEATPATDVYALGILGDACFGGRPPADWEAILGKATNAVPRRRYAGVGAMMEAIRGRGG